MVSPRNHLEIWSGTSAISQNHIAYGYYVYIVIISILPNWGATKDALPQRDSFGRWVGLKNG